MAMEHVERYLRGLGHDDLAYRVSRVHEELRQRHPGLTDIPLLTGDQQQSSDSQATTQAQGSVGSPEALPLRLKLIPFEIEIPEVPESVYIETRKAVEATGALIFQIRPVTVDDLVEEDQLRAREELTITRLNDNMIVNMRLTVPPEMEAFINPDAAEIEGSNHLSTDDQKRKIVEATVTFREKLPEAVRPFVNLHMVDPSTLLQLEIAVMDQTDDCQFLFPDFFARTDIETIQGNTAVVGRRMIASFFCGVFDRKRDEGYEDVFAVPVGVLPRRIC